MMKAQRARPGYILRYLLLTLVVFGVTSYWLLHSPPARDDPALASCSNQTIADQHPVKQLHEQALVQFEALQRRQSNSLENATTEYRHRYGREPPWGFDEWFGLATENHAVIFDEYDTLMELIEPYWKLSPEELADNFARASEGPLINKLIIKDGNATVTDENLEGEYIRYLLGETTWNLPDVELLMNPMVEPRVLNTDTQGRDWQDASGKGNLIVKPCKSRPKTGMATSDPCHDTRGLPFVTDLPQAKDICQNEHYSSQHGFLINSSLSVTTLKAPILSRAITNTFSDILYPSMYYFTHGIWRFDDFDIEWDTKDDQLYWAGDTSGGRALHKPLLGSPVEQHRMRANRIANELGNETYTFLERNEEDTAWQPRKSTKVGTDLFDLKFTDASECSEAQCRQIREQYVFADPDEKRKWFQTKLIMDMDGKSVSGRFYNFIKSRSCPLKMTIFREWHDDRLVPWVHYIPVSIGMQELPELVRYLTSTREGIAIARKVADMGSEWHDLVLRQEDAALYIYRLILEYARVMHPGRDRGEMDMLPATSRYIEDM